MTIMENEGGVTRMDRVMEYIMGDGNPRPVSADTRRKVEESLQGPTPSLIEQVFDMRRRKVRIGLQDGRELIIEEQPVGRWLEDGILDAMIAVVDSLDQDTKSAISAIWSESKRPKKSADGEAEPETQGSKKSAPDEAEALGRIAFQILKHKKLRAAFIEFIAAYCGMTPKDFSDSVGPADLVGAIVGIMRVARLLQIAQNFFVLMRIKAVIP